MKKASVALGFLGLAAAIAALGWVLHKNGMVSDKPTPVTRKRKNHHRKVYHKENRE